jgi:hypothetical protein
MFRYLYEINIYLKTIPMGNKNILWINIRANE